jgi:hypothetical protein
VLTFFVHRHTNAHAESMNSRIQAMIKKARTVTETVSDYAPTCSFILAP